MESRLVRDASSGFFVFRNLVNLVFEKFLETEISSAAPEPSVAKTHPNPG